MQRLNEPSVLSMVALLPDDGEAVRRAVRGHAEAWRAALAPEAGTALAIRTQKHMNPKTFHVGKATKALAFEAAREERIWPTLFDPASGYQSVMIGLHPPGAPQPLAGITLQAELSVGAGLAEVGREAIERFLPEASRALVGPRRAAGGTLHAAFWAVNDPAAFARLGFPPEEAIRAFEGWIGSLAPLQAWIARSAWIPEFDTYDAYHQTLYEAAAAVDWFRSGRQHAVMSAAWSGLRLRYVAPLLWLGQDLAGRVDPEALRRVAEIDREGATLRVALRREASLNDLEAALAPILPMAIAA